MPGNVIVGAGPFEAGSDVVVDIVSLPNDQLVAEAAKCAESKIGGIFYFDLSELPAGNYAYKMSNGQAVLLGSFEIP